MTEYEVRSPRADERTAVLATIRAADLLPGDGVDEVGVDLDDFLQEAPDAGRWWIALALQSIVGVAYAISERMTDRTWNLLLLAVHPDHQGRGCGSAVVSAIERGLAARNVRLVVIETSGVPSFAGQRRFYARLGYAEQARIPDFFEAGDDKVVFTQQLPTGE